jgi:hypothetical protein
MSHQFGNLASLATRYLLHLRALISLSADHEMSIYYVSNNMLNSIEGANINNLRFYSHVVKEFLSKDVVS